MGSPMGKSELVDTMVNDALWDATGYNMHMGMTAENVCTNETYQKKYGYNPITREELDAFSYRSQERLPRLLPTVLSRMRSSPLSSRVSRATPCLIPMKVPA